MHWQGNKGEPGLQGMPGASGLKVIIIWGIQKYIQRIISFIIWWYYCFVSLKKSYVKWRILYITELTNMKENGQCEVSFVFLDSLS